MDFDSLVQSIQDISAETALIIGGLVALLVVIAYRIDKDSLMYKVIVVVGLAIGIIMILVGLSDNSAIEESTMVILVVAGFALAVRPFRNVNFALVIALIAAIAIYLYMATLAGDENLSQLSEGWPRIIVALVGGAIVYAILNFLQAVSQAIGKLLNWWPFLTIIAILCVIEGIMVYMGYGSVYDYLKDPIENVASQVNL